MILFQAPESESDVQLSVGDEDVESVIESAGRTPVSKGKKRRREVRIRCRRNVARILTFAVLLWLLLLAAVWLFVFEFRSVFGCAQNGGKGATL